MKYNDWLNFWLENYIEPNAKMRTTESYRGGLSIKDCGRNWENAKWANSPLRRFRRSSRD